MKKIITLALALVMVLAIAVPCFAALTEADGVYTAEGDSQAPYKDDASTHYTIEADFSDLKDADHGGNGCCGFIIGKNNSEGQCLAIYLTGNGTFGWTGYGKWWTHNPAKYTVQGDTWETRFAHIKVAYFNDNGNVTVTATCNDLTINITAEAFETELKAKGLTEVEPLTDGSHITIVEKINGGQIKNVVYTDLTAPKELDVSNAEWTVGDGEYTAPEHTHGNTFEYYLLGNSDTAVVEYIYAANPSQAGVMFGIADCDGDGTINEAGDQYYYATVKDTVFQIERNDKTWGGWTVNNVSIAPKAGDLITLEYDKAAGKITLKINDEVIKEYVDENASAFTGNGYGLCAKGAYTFKLAKEIEIPDDPEDPKPTGTAAIVVSMVALVSLAAVTVVAKKRH